LRLGNDSLHLRGCSLCGLVQVVREIPAGHGARCRRCRAPLERGPGAGGRNRKAGWAALAALLLYPLAISLPILRLEQLGRANETSAWSGSLGLIADGHLWVGGVVFLCSIVIPLLKLLTLLVLAHAPRRLELPRRANAWRMLELIGRWGMLDVLLVSIVVACLKLGDRVEVTAGPAAIAFAACVLASLLASAWFDPRELLHEERAP